MEIFVDWDGKPEEDSLLELGGFEDLEHLVKLLNKAWKGKIKYRLDAIKNESGAYLFTEDHADQDYYDCGVVHKIEDKAMALSQSVHDLVMGSYHRFVDHFGDEASAA